MKFFGSFRKQVSTNISKNSSKSNISKFINLSKDNNLLQISNSTAKNFHSISNYLQNFQISKTKIDNSFNSIIPMKNFCDTISNSDDVGKLINLISRETMDKIPQKNIRNFCIIAHIDHGKSTLSDRLLEKSGAINKLEKKNAQFLDTLKVERERGITVKAQTATMIYTHKSEDYILNLIDTPGHVDFAYEVARSLRPCQGALLLVDASKGVQAQTLSNYNQAKNLGLKICPIVNKIDLPTANVESTIEQMKHGMEFEGKNILQISAKTGINLEKVFDLIIDDVPPPNGDSEKPLRYFLFKS